MIALAKIERARVEKNEREREIERERDREGGPEVSPSF